ncbi:alpha/beta fold hydrolase [Novosphingobium taihuense]|nr:alpha/beta hydrolase [Novosphingobium taihuense]
MIQTADGISISVETCGSGRPIVLVHGWSQSAQLFSSQIAALSDRFHVIAYDQRGHGLSDKPNQGYRVHRLAHDLAELLAYLNLRDVTLLGHSMGCSVIWAYLDLFGTDRLHSLVLVDQSACLLRGRHWSEQQASDWGGLFSESALFELVDQLRGPDGVDSTKAVLASMLTPGGATHLLDPLLEQNLLFPRIHAAQLLTNHGMTDWSDVIAQIRLPALVVGCGGSLISTSSMQWIARQIPGSKYVEFSVQEGGSHFPFLENPDLFNQVLLTFLDGQA